VAPSPYAGRLRGLRESLTRRAAVILEAAGIIAIAVGIAFYSPPAGIIAAGVGLLAFGLAAERNG
jgi:hypothetical protein